MLRPSEYIHIPERVLKNCDHCLKAGDVLFEIISNENSEQIFIDATQISNYSFNQVVLVKLILRSRKNDVMRAGKIFCFPSKCRENSINIAKLAFDWSQAARLNPNSVFMSYRSLKNDNTFYYLKYDHLTSILKKCAVHHKLSEKNFSLYSLRIGGATHLRAGNAGDSMIKFLGGWKSLDCSLMYQESSLNEFSRIQDMFSDDTLFTIEDVIRQSTKHHANISK
jgi:hypothetical protein